MSTTSDRIIEELYSRGGFDAWWDSIDSEFQEQIKSCISEISENGKSELKAHLALCVQLFEGICDEAGIDTETTTMNVAIGEHQAKMPIGKMIAKWKEMSK